MAHVPADVALTKPVEKTHPDNLPDANDPNDIVAALQELSDKSEQEDDVRKSMHAPMHQLWTIPFIHKLIPGLEKLASQYHVGNFVIVRSTGEKIFESMPVYPRLGMHLMFYGGTQIKLLHNHTVESILKDLSIRQGKVYDSPESVKSIPSFIQTYSISLDELEQPDITKYKCFNDFFSRKLRPGMRPVQDADDPLGFCSAADSRLTVYPTVDAAKQFWVKGNNFSIASLLGVEPGSDQARMFEGGSVAIFRLAPQDYHRFHSPIDGVVGDVHDIPGQYYTVNPQAVNESGFDVFTENRRAIQYMKHSQSNAPIAFVAVGAMLVGSIIWTAGKGAAVKRGDELGYFAYGGSTVVVLFPKSLIQFDDDLSKNSDVPIETLVKVGESIGHSVLPTAGFSPASVLRGGDIRSSRRSSVAKAGGGWDVWGSVSSKCTVL
ncbi:phosphatidylserine decarboxylase-domain-containing protein [Ganoderma leucocontextum]|nr:phosphatidylserine decarboxylase-domain-containing protein [Ganoderma leucocontextum]KAI1782782.1 phosphatidylserine decarboxylase-domain-containing protein [Ganoderma leucocontextum]